MPIAIPPETTRPLPAVSQSPAAHFSGPDQTAVLMAKYLSTNDGFHRLAYPIRNGRPRFATLTGRAVRFKGALRVRPQDRIVRIPDPVVPVPADRQFDCRRRRTLAPVTPVPHQINAIGLQHGGTNSRDRSRAASGFRTGPGMTSQALPSALTASRSTHGSLDSSVYHLRQRSPARERFRIRPARHETDPPVR